MNTTDATRAAITLLTALAAGNAADAQTNLVDNPSFEGANAAPWFVLGNPSLTTTNNQAADGERSAIIFNRDDAKDGIAQNIDPNLITDGGIYRINAQVRVFGPVTSDIRGKVRVADSNGGRLNGVMIPADRTIADDRWYELDTIINGNITDYTGALQQFRLSFDSVDPGVNFFVDDVELVELVEGDWRAMAAAGIDEHRMRDVVVTVTDGQGNPIPDASVQLAQSSRRFKIGTAVQADDLNKPAYANFIRNNFDTGTPENAFKWKRTEPTENNYTWANADRIYDFLRSNGLEVYGHNIFWANPNNTPDWVTAKTGQALQDAVDKRLNDLVTRFAAHTTAWDVNNETVHFSFYRERLGDDVFPAMHTAAAQLDPSAQLFVNDFNIVAVYSPTETTHLMTQVDQLIAAGAPIHGIGAQCHFPGTVNAAIVRDRLQKLSDFAADRGIAVRCTEFHTESPDDAVRAESLEKFFRTAFSIPHVDGITLWGFWAGAHFRGADAALLDQDFSVNAAGQMFLDLLDEWTTNATLTTDPAGVTAQRAFFGDYTLTVAAGSELPVTTTFTLEPGDDPFTDPHEITIVIEATGCAATGFALPINTASADDVSVFELLFGMGDPLADFALPSPTLDFFDHAAFLDTLAKPCPQ